MNTENESIPTTDGRILNEGVDPETGRPYLTHDDPKFAEGLEFGREFIAGTTEGSIPGLPQSRNVATCEFVFVMSIMGGNFTMYDAGVAAAVREWREANGESTDEAEEAE